MKKNNKKIAALFSLFFLALGMGFSYPVNDDNVRCRTAPSLKYSKVVTKVNRGFDVQIEHGALDEDGNTWYYFNHEKYGRLWIFAQFVTVPEAKRNEIYNWNRTWPFAETLDSEIFKIAIKESEEKTLAQLKKNGTLVESLNSGIRNYDGPSIKTKYLTYRNDYGTIKFLETDGGENYRLWLIDITVEKDFSNSFGIKMGDSLYKIMEIFGTQDDDVRELEDGAKKIFISYSYSEFDGVTFRFDKNDRLKSISIGRSGGLGN